MVFKLPVTQGFQSQTKHFIWPPTHQFAWSNALVLIELKFASQPECFTVWPPNTSQLQIICWYRNTLTNDMCDFNSFLVTCMRTVNLATLFKSICKFCFCKLTLTWVDVWVHLARASQVLFLIFYNIFWLAVILRAEPLSRVKSSAHKNNSQGEITASCVLALDVVSLWKNKFV